MCSKSGMVISKIHFIFQNQSNHNKNKGIKLTRENVGKANAENFIAFNISGFCDRQIEKRKVRRKSTPHGQSICCIPLLDSNISWIHLSFAVFPCQLHSYSSSEVCKLYEIKASKMCVNAPSREYLLLTNWIKLFPFQHKMNSCDNADTIYTTSLANSAAVNFTWNIIFNFNYL